MPRITLVLCCVLMLGATLFACATETPANAPVVEFPLVPRGEPDFIDALAGSGMQFENPESAKGVGHGVCDALESEVDPSHVSDLLVQTLPITPAEAQVFVVTAVDAFCPQLAGSRR